MGIILDLSYCVMNDVCMVSVVLREFVAYATSTANVVVEFDDDLGDFVFKDFCESCFLCVYCVLVGDL